jgi:hypothetical protein
MYFFNIDTTMKIPLRLVCHVTVIEEPRYDYNISPENHFEKTSILGRLRRLKGSFGMNIRERTTKMVSCSTYVTIASIEEMYY